MNYSNVSSENDTVEYDEVAYFSREWLNTFMTALQLLIMITGGIGNLAVLIILIFKPIKTQKVTQIFITSLTVANVSSAVGYQWIMAMMYYRNGWWTLGLAICKINYFLQGLTAGASSWSIAALLMDR